MQKVLQNTLQNTSLNSNNRFFPSVCRNLSGIFPQFFLLCYTIDMNDFYKEFGKLIYDFAKITFAVAIITPIVKSGEYSFYPIVTVVGLIVVGSYLVYKGTKNGNT